MGRLSTIHFYIILKHTPGFIFDSDCLSTIHFYIILKLKKWQTEQFARLSTIHFYIILKLYPSVMHSESV